jgi:hypothetical protein
VPLASKLSFYPFLFFILLFRGTKRFLGAREFSVKSLYDRIALEQAWSMLSYL